MRTHAKELNGLAPDILVAESTPATAALRQEARVPIVFLQVANPMGRGLRCKPRASERQHHRVHQFRALHGW